MRINQEVVDLAIEAFRNPSHDPKLKKGVFTLKVKTSDHFVEDVKTLTLTTDQAKARRFSSAYLNTSCWDWSLVYDAVQA